DGVAPRVVTEVRDECRLSDSQSRMGRGPDPSSKLQTGLLAKVGGAQHLSGRVATIFNSQMQFAPLPGSVCVAPESGCGFDRETKVRVVRGLRGVNLAGGLVLRACGLGENSHRQPTHANGEPSNGDPFAQSETDHRTRDVERDRTRGW